MRLFIFTLFLTFVWYCVSQGAPLNEPRVSHPLLDLQKNSEYTEEIETVPQTSQQIQLGYLYGKIFSTDDSINNVYLGYGKKIELDFEKYLLVGAMYDFSKTLGIFVKSELGHLNLIDIFLLEHLEIGLQHFINSKDGISNLVNINHTKFYLGYTFYNLITLSAAYGFYGLSIEGHLALWF